MTDTAPGLGEDDKTFEQSQAPGSIAEAAVEASSPSAPRPFGRRKSTSTSSERAVKQTQTESEDEDDNGDSDEDMEEEEEEEEEEEGSSEEEDEDDEEPRLKYESLTKHLGPLYRNADATSSFLVGGDKMVVGTHNGNIHVLQLPSFHDLRTYHAHSASVTAVSISPFPPPVNAGKPEVAMRAIAQATGGKPGSPVPTRDTAQSGSGSAAAARKPREAPQIPNLPSNQIYIATASMDGNVCVQSLIDAKDVQLRNFARPVHAVALSPDYKNDRTYLSGGTAGSLILTVGGAPGRSTSSTVGTAAATASGWLGSMGLGGNTGKDTVLHSGEGTISTIKWSLTGKYVVWLNEHGIKIMRSRLHLEGGDPDDAWKRIGHYDRPQTDEWETMAGVWKGRVEWIDEDAVPASDEPKAPDGGSASLAVEKLKKKQTERLLVGWGGTIWIIHVHGAGKNDSDRNTGRAEMVKILRMDCIISGISLYTQSLLLVLAYPLNDDDDEDEDGDGKKSKGTGPSGGVRRHQNHLPPEIRLIDLVSQEEMDRDTLAISRFERLTSSDYHLGVLPQQTASVVTDSKGYLQAMVGLGTDVWNVAMLPTKVLFNSAASVRSAHSNDAAPASTAPSITGSIRIPHQRQVAQNVHPSLAKPGIKIFVHSPYDCFVATKRDLSDHLSWLVERHEYERAWELVDENPDIAVTTESLLEASSTAPSRAQATDDFYTDTVSTVDDAAKQANAIAEKEKRRIGELWLQQLVDSGDWERAGQVAGRVLTSSEQWEKWVYAFGQAGKFDEITNFIPLEPMQPRIPLNVYEVVLKHYIQTDKLRLKDLLDRWHPDLFDVSAIATTLENQLKYRDVRPDSFEDGIKGRDWRIVVEGLAKLCEVNGRHREALRYYIKLQDADSAMRLIRENHLADALTDDIPSFVTLRVPADGQNHMSMLELEQATAEAITLLVDEAQHGLVRPETVVSQLREKDLNLFLFFYLRALFRGEGVLEHAGENRERLIMESQSLVEDFADLAVHLFALYDQSILMDLLKTSTSYTFEKAVRECEDHSYIPELVYLYSKTGQMKRALYLIIDRLGDVSRAIAFAKELNDPDLWEDLLKYSMDKPRFIRGLLEEVGTAINPITLVKRIPEGLEIEGLREGLKHIMKEHEIQYSISEGVARVLRSEVAAAQATLRSGQRKGIKFEVMVKNAEHVDVEVKSVATDIDPIDSTEGKKAVAGEKGPGQDLVPAAIPYSQPKKAVRKWKPGHCAAAQCLEPFSEWEEETLLGFACGHVYHLSHLLQVLHPDQPVDGIAGFGAQAVDEDQGGDGQHGGRRTVGAKVMHARLLRDRIGGCPICGKAEERS